MLPVGLGFLFRESLVEAVLVLVGAAMNEKMEDGGREHGREGRYAPEPLYVSRLRRGGIRSEI